jgi:hypothetical protein
MLPKSRCASPRPRSPLMCVASFGSVVFAPSEQQLSILFDILEELHLPFILAQGNAQDGNCPPEVREMMLQRVGKGKNRGLLLPWAPQRAILDHPVSPADED